MYPRNVSFLAFCGILSCCVAAMADDLDSNSSIAPQWQQVEIGFVAENKFRNAYVECQAWVEFVHEDGTKIRRPMFWDGGQTFRVRFASTESDGV